jgi:RNA-directed DNA polymerase
MDGFAAGRDGVSPRAIEKDLDQTARLLQRKMRAGTYQFTSYREVVLSKGAKSLPRVVSIPTARDRVALKTLALVLVATFPEARTPMAQIRVSELSAALSRANFDTYVRVDVKNFYPSISHRAVNDQLRKRIRSRTVRHLISRAISTPTLPTRAPKPIHSVLEGVPQGLSVSNALAEIAMIDIDAFFQAEQNIEYFRYVDDILILCDSDNADGVLAEVSRRCSMIGLETHALGIVSKTQIGPLTSEFDYLGYLFGPNGVGVRASSVQRLESTIVQLFTAYKYEISKNASDLNWAKAAQDALEWRLNLVISGCVFDHIPRGWLHYFSQMDDWTLLSRLDAYVLSMKRRFKVPSDFQVKSFVRAHWHIKKPNSLSERYIPNFDKYSESQKRWLLGALFPDQNFKNLPLSELNRRFRAEVGRLVSMLERDVSETS